jgi:HK97 gp10 family phage protein
LELINMTDDLDAYLNALPDRLTEQLSGVVREQAELLSAAQREALQSLEQSPEETGDLEASCTVVPGGNDLEFFVQAGGDLTTKDIREGSGKPYDYAVGFEFGTSHQSARPFFYSTYNAMRDDMQDAINEAVSEVLK